jgi:hypothetical protein
VRSRNRRTHNLIRVFLVGQPGPHTTSLEQRLALSDALLAPFPRECVAVHHVAPNVLVLHEPVKGIQIPRLDRVISQSFGAHAGGLRAGNDEQCVDARAHG